MLPAVQDHASAPKSRKHDSIAKSLAHYTPSVLFRTVVGVLNTIIRPKLLGPQWFGLWSLLNIIPAYASYLQLGTRDYMRFTIPRLEAHDDDSTVHKVESSVFWGTLIPNCGVAAALLATAACMHLETDIRIGLAAMALLTILTCMYEYGVNLMKGHQMFRDLSHVMYLRNASQLILSVFLMLYMGLYGLLIALPLSLSISLLYLRTRYPFDRIGRFSWPFYCKMVREGFPLAILAFLMTLMITSGRLLVAGYLTTAEVGFYALATIALRGMLDFPQAAREVVESRLMEKSDSLKRKTVLDQYLYRPLVINACYVPLVITPLYFVLPHLIRLILPLYTDGIAPLKIVLFGFYFLSIFYPLRGIIVALHMQKQAAMLTGVCVLINIGLSLIALETGFGIIGVSIANNVSYAILLILTIGLLRLQKGIPFPLKKTWPLITAFLLFCGAIWISKIWLEPLTGSGFIGALIQSGILFISGILLLVIAEYRLPLLKGISPLSAFRIMLRK